MPNGGSNPLTGLKIVVTRPLRQAKKLVQALQSLGATLIEFPTIEIQFNDDWDDPGPLDCFDWAVFTSANAVIAFAEELSNHHRSMTELQNVPICAIGPGTTQALEKFALHATLLPKESIAESVLEALSTHSGDLRAKRILLPRGNIARPFLRDELTTLGAHVTAPIVYDTNCPDPPEHLRDALVASQLDLVIFTSSSTAENFHTILGPERIARLHCAYASIGPETTKAATRAGLPISIEPPQHDIPSLVTAIVAWSPR